MLTHWLCWCSEVVDSARWCSQVAVPIALPAAVRKLELPHSPWHCPPVIRLLLIVLAGMQRYLPVVSPWTSLVPEETKHLFYMLLCQLDILPVRWLLRFCPFFSNGLSAFWICRNSSYTLPHKPLQICVIPNISTNSVSYLFTLIMVFSSGLKSFSPLDVFVVPSCFLPVSD